MAIGVHPASIASRTAFGPSITISSSCSWMARRTRLNQAFPRLVIIYNGPLSSLDDTEAGVVLALDLSNHPAFRVCHRLGSGSRTVPDLAGTGAGDPRLASDDAGVRGRGGDRLGSRERSVADAPGDRQFHGQPAASRRTGMADDLLRRRGIPEKVLPREARRRTFGGDLRPGAADRVLHVHMVERDAER